MDKETEQRILYWIKEEWDRGDLPYIAAIEELQKRLNYSAIQAEIVVSEWEDGSEP